LFAICQQVFKTEARFNNVDVSFFFLISALFVQFVAWQFIFRFFYTRHYGKTSLEEVINLSAKKK
jgi:hypothetical protein